MSSAVTDESPAPAKGLSSGSLGLWGNTVIGLASTAPAYSLAATLGYVVLAVGEKSPAMFLIAFVPMLLVAIAYRELNSVMPDCGTTFTWGAKALGPWVGWLGGWGLAVSGIIVLANVAEVAAVYFLRAFGLDEVAENRIAVLLIGVPLVALAVLPGPLMALLALTALGIGYSLVETAGITRLQRLTRDEHRARAFAALESTYWLTTGAGAMLAPLLIHATGVRGALLIAGAALPLTLLLTRLVPLKVATAVRPAAV